MDQIKCCCGHNKQQQENTKSAVSGVREVPTCVCISTCVPVLHFSEDHSDWFRFYIISVEKRSLRFFNRNPPLPPRLVETAGPALLRVCFSCSWGAALGRWECGWAWPPWCRRPEGWRRTTMESWARSSARGEGRKCWCAASPAPNWEGEQRPACYQRDVSMNGWRKVSGSHSPLGEIKLIEPDGAAKRVIRVLHHLQDLLFILFLFLPFCWNTIWIWGRHMHSLHKKRPMRGSNELVSHTN